VHLYTAQSGTGISLAKHAEDKGDASHEPNILQAYFSASRLLQFVSVENNM
jgi:hypothetical protein